jgi:hypothetical protein
MAALLQSLIVLSKTEEVNLFLLTVPVTPDALKESCPVVEGVGHNPDLGLGQGDKLLMKKGIRWHC